MPKENGPVDPDLKGVCSENHFCVPTDPTCYGSDEDKVVEQVNAQVLQVGIYGVCSESHKCVCPDEGKGKKKKKKKTK